MSGSFTIRLRTKVLDSRGAMPSVETSTTAKMLDVSKETHARA
jgi:hypothetical protein